MGEEKISWIATRMLVVTPPLIIIFCASQIDKPEEGEHLVPDFEAYDCLFPMNAEWPALSFDFVEDRNGPRRGFPMTVNIVAGTQVDKSSRVDVAHL
jgi:hypothetical protein